MITVSPTKTKKIYRDNGRPAILVGVTSGQATTGTHPSSDMNVPKLKKKYLQYN